MILSSLTNLYSDVLGELSMIADAFPFNLKNDVVIAMNAIPMKTYSDISVAVSENRICYRFGDMDIQIPYRIYYIDISDDAYRTLNIQQKLIVHCIYTRSCRGFIREKHLKALLAFDYPNWATPFIVKLCDEYVIQILETIYGHFKTKDNQELKDFCSDNSLSFHKSYDRMISYWNCYYRWKYKYLSDYVGFKLFKECLGYSKIITTS